MALVMSGGREAIIDASCLIGGGPDSYIVNKKSRTSTTNRQSKSLDCSVSNVHPGVEEDRLSDSDGVPHDIVMMAHSDDDIVERRGEREFSNELEFEFLQ